MKYPYHKQNTKTYCGPACVQMILQNADQNRVLPSQVSLYQTIGSDVNDYSTPNGLSKVLNILLPHLMMEYTVSASPDGNEVYAAIKQSLKRGAPAIVKRDFGKHWFVAFALYDDHGKESLFVGNPKAIYSGDDPVQMAAVKATPHGKGQCICGWSNETLAYIVDDIDSEFIATTTSDNLYIAVVATRKRITLPNLAKFVWRKTVGLPDLWKKGNLPVGKQLEG